MPETATPKPPTYPVTVLRLAIAHPISELFDYLPQKSTQINKLKPGMRFQVNFANREIIAFFINSASHSTVNPDKLKTVNSQIDATNSPIDAQLFKLIQWSAHYYHFNIGMCLHAALPKKIRQGSELVAHTTAWQLSSYGLGLSSEALKNAKKQQALVHYLRQHKIISHSELKNQGFNKSIVKALIEKSLISELTIEKQHTVQAASATQHALLKDPQLELNTQQQQALEAITASTQFSCHLLYGVTGSGKTEVYMQAIAKTLEQGEQALVLIPEIALTPQMIARFTQRFSCPVVNMHSKLGDGQRFKHWQQARDGEAAIIIGTRSAVFAPFKQLGIIIVDEEHDSSYKQQSGFRYSAKDVAIRRAQLLDIPIVLGSATPSCESLYNVQQGRYQQHLLSARANAAEQPLIKLIDTRNQVLQDGFSEQLLQAIHKTLANNEQVLVFINRRGYAPTLLCHSCGWIAGCNHCDARLTIHRKVRQLRCHHCGSQQPLVLHCPTCKSSELRALGSGTQRSERFLKDYFKETPIIRIDSDSTSAKASLETLLEPLNSNRAALLIGTQMLAKGHHFPNVTLVAILDSDTWLFSNDFRGDERMAQLMTQVSGRSGRGAKKGQTLIQTHLPEHPFWQQFFNGGYPTLSKHILAQRRATLMPPFAYLCLFHAEHPHPEKAYSLLKQVRTWLAEHTLAEAEHLECIGPYPSTLTRKAGHYRFLLQLKHVKRKSLHQAVNAARLFLGTQKLAKKVHWSINIDPQDTN